MHDWAQIINDLRARPMTQRAIAAAVGASQASISELRAGVTAEPRYALGHALITLHQRLTAKPRHRTAAR